MTKQCEEKIGEKSCLKKCEDCNKFFHKLEGNRWCEECFDRGLHRDMNEHWQNYFEEKLGTQKECPLCKVKSLTGTVHESSCEEMKEKGE